MSDANRLGDEIIELYAYIYPGGHLVRRHTSIPGIDPRVRRP